MVGIICKNRAKKNQKTTVLANKDEDNYEQWRCYDPYPNIEAALLNSADVLAYVKKTSMLTPFDSSKLQGASYDVPIEGRVIYWDDKGKKQEKELIRDGDYFDLFPNSIAFVTLQPYFRIPLYLALRFNLKITHIYKGLLLGTGPLVDPGFCGKLSIPLHNLTGNTYRFFKGDELITMEFTKMSRNEKWRTDEVNVGHSEKYIENCIIGDRKVDDYVTKALKKDRLETVISSIPSTMLESKKAITKAESTIGEMRKEAGQIRNWSTALNIAGIVGIATVVITAVGFNFDAYTKVNERYDKLQEEAQEKQSEYEQVLDDMKNEIKLLNDELSELKKEGRQT